MSRREHEVLQGLVHTQLDIYGGRKHTSTTMKSIIHIVLLPMR